MKIIELINKKFSILRDQKINQEISYRSSNLWTKTLIWSIMGSLGFGIVFACVARIDEVVIARGELQPTGAKRPIKAPSSSIISGIYIEEGQEVSIDQTLIRLNDEVFQEKLRGLNNTLDSLNISRNLQKEILKSYSFAFQEGALTRLNVLEQMDKLQQINNDIAQVESQIKEIKIEQNQKALKSPVNGRVFNLIPYNEGYSASEGEVLLYVVPYGPLEAKVYLSNKDIGFVKKDMQVDVKIDAYPFTQFGTIDGKLTTIGDEVIPPSEIDPQKKFPAYITLNKQYLEKKDIQYPVKSGQSISANLLVRDKPVITLLTDATGKIFESLKSIRSKEN